MRIELNECSDLQPAYLKGMAPDRDTEPGAGRDSSADYRFDQLASCLVYRKIASNHARLCIK